MGCKMDSAGCASFWIRPRTWGFNKISNISDYLSDYQICKDSVPWNFSFNHMQACEYLHLATICNFYSSPRAKSPVSLTPVPIFGIISHWYPGHHLDKFLQISQHTYTRFPSMFKLFSPFDIPTDDLETTFLSALSSYLPYTEDILAQDKD